MRPAPDLHATRMSAGERQAKDAIYASQQALREVAQALDREEFETAERLLDEAERLNAMIRGFVGREAVLRISPHAASPSVHLNSSTASTLDW